VSDHGWTEYYDAHHDREPRAMLLDVLAQFGRPGDAIDIGFGNGIETVAMLQRGWRVLAIDADAEAHERLDARVPADVRDRLEVRRSRIEDIAVVPVDLVWAAFSLFFCDPGRFAEVWERLREAVRPGGRFAGQLLGERDSWATEPGISAFTVDAARGLFQGWSVERFDEEEFDGEACSGAKHWHLFHVVARRPE
jgi:SAM-dependent methyltransferase